MNDSGIETKLKDNGFTDNDIVFIKKWSEKEKISHPDAIKQIYRFFFGVSVFLFFLTVIAVYELLNSDDFTLFLIAYVFGVCVFMFFAPMWLGAKVFVFIRRKGLDYLL